VVEREPHCLLRGAGALDWPSRLGEDRGTFLELCDGREDLCAGVVAVDGGDEGRPVSEGGGEAFYGGVVDADAGADDEVVVGESLAGGEGEGVGGGREGGYGGGVEFELRVEKGGQGVPEVFAPLEAAAHEGPAGLVVVRGGGVDDGQVVLGEFPGEEELVRDGEAGGAAADEDNFVGVGGGRDWGVGWGCGCGGGCEGPEEGGADVAGGEG